MHRRAFRPGELDDADGERAQREGVRKDDGAGGEEGFERHNVLVGEAITEFSWLLKASMVASHHAMAAASDWRKKSEAEARFSGAMLLRLGEPVS